MSSTDRPEPAESAREQAKSPEEQHDRIDRAYYDGSDYFEDGAEHLQDMESAFQRYRVANVLEIHPFGPDDRVLDLGCGWGTFSFALAARVGEVVGVDFSERSVELCRRRLAESGVENVSFLCRDGGDTGLPEGSFDAVLAADLFEHLYPDDSVRVTEEAFRVLRPRGHFVIWTPHRGHILEILKNRGILLKPDPTHVDYKSMDRLRSMLVSAGFEIDRAYYVESHLPVLRTLERWCLRAVPILRRRIAVLARKPTPLA